MFHTGFDLENVAQFCSLFKKEIPFISVCVISTLFCSVVSFSLCSNGLAGDCASLLQELGSFASHNLV